MLYRKSQLFNAEIGGNEATAPRCNIQLKLLCTFLKPVLAGQNRPSPSPPLQQKLQNSTTHNVVGKTCIIASLTIGKDITVGSQIVYANI